jgi:hypothetical protein
MKLPKIVWKLPKLPIYGINSGPVGYLSGTVRHFKGYQDPETKEYFNIPYDPTITHLEPVYDYQSDNPEDWHQFAKPKHNLLTNAGKDYLHAQYWTNNSAGGVGVNFIALTESTITPAVTDTTLSGEITTNGLARTIASTRSHSAGANTTVLSLTFTASGSFTDVKASALFNASSSGTMGHIANFATGSGTLSSGDQIAVTWTCTAS